MRLALVLRNADKEDDVWAGQKWVKEFMRTEDDQDSKYGMGSEISTPIPKSCANIREMCKELAETCKGYSDYTCRMTSIQIQSLTMADRDTLYTYDETCMRITEICKKMGFADDEAIKTNRGSQAESVEPEPGWKQVEAKKKGKGKADEPRKAIEIAGVTATGSSTVVEQAARGRSRKS